MRRRGAGVVESVYCAYERTEGVSKFLRKSNRKDGYKKGGERERKEEGRGRNGGREGRERVRRGREGGAKERRKERGAGRESGVREGNEAHAARREDVLPAAPQRQNTEKTSGLTTHQIPITRKYIAAYPCSPNLAAFLALLIPHLLASIGNRLWLSTGHKNGNSTTL